MKCLVGAYLLSLWEGLQWTMEQLFSANWAVSIGHYSSFFDVYGSSACNALSVHVSSFSMWMFAVDIEKLLPANWAGSIRHCSPFFDVYGYSACNALFVHVCSIFVNVCSGLWNNYFHQTGQAVNTIAHLSLMSMDLVHVMPCQCMFALYVNVCSGQWHNFFQQTGQTV